MNTHTLKRDIPLEDTWDVLVVGGGPAGCAAATAAAEQGARTLLVEATGCLGGMGTAGLVPAWCPFSDKQGQVLYTGLPERVLRESRKAVPHVPDDRLDWVPIHPEHLKRVYDDLLAGAGVEVRFQTLLAGVDTDGQGRLAAVLLAGKAGLSAVRAKVTVDATGDGDLAARAGAPFEKGDPDDGDLQPATHCFQLVNVDTYAVEHLGSIRWGKPPEHIFAILASGKYPAIPDAHAGHHLVGPGVAGFNAGHLWGVDPTDPPTVSRALAEGRRLAETFRNAFADFFPAAFGNAHLAATAPLLGVRESRRILGDYVLSVEDFQARRSFPDDIARNNYYIDVHIKRSETDAYNRGHKKQEDSGELKIPDRRMGPGEWHGIPYRCLTPRGLSDVLVAGRCISADRPVQGSVRVMPACLATGEAAGCAAELACRTGPVDTRAVDVRMLRETLRRRGVTLPEA